MLLRGAAYYGLVACLIALLALGMQPLRAGKLATAQQEAPRNVPEQDTGDEEEELEEESEEVLLLRRKVVSWHHGVRMNRLTCSDVSQSLRPSAPSPARSLCRELAARNGIGGPLRL